MNSKVISIKDKIKPKITGNDYLEGAVTQGNAAPILLPDFKIRCSSLGSIMTEPREKAAKKRGELSETAKTHLVELYVEYRYGRTKKVENKYVEKGRAVEEDGIDLYSELHRNFYQKNKERLTNDYITGEPDMFVGKDILYADRIIDTKCSWDLHTFIKAKIDKVNKDYYWQGMGYMFLTGARSFSLAYCLINTPTTLILDEKRRLAYRMEVIDEMRPDYIEACKEIDRNCIFNDIPKSERMFEIHIERDYAAIENIKRKVIQCRQWIADTFQYDTLTDTLSKSILLQQKTN